MNRLFRMLLKLMLPFAILLVAGVAVVACRIWTHGPSISVRSRQSQIAVDGHRARAGIVVSGRERA